MSPARRRTGIALAVAALCCAALSAQRRQPLIGRVVDGDGAPLAGAEVTIACNPGGHADLAPAMAAVGKTTARGYFAIPAPSGVPLVVWAIGPAAADGSRAAAAPRPCAVGARRLELTADERAHERAVTITGLVAWSSLGPFTLRAHPCPWLDLTVDAALDADGKGTLPPTRDDWFHLELVTAAGETLHAWRGNPAGATLTLAVPAPFELHALCVDDTGEPAAGVTLWHQSADIRDWNTPDLQTGPRDRWRQVGTSDAAGAATLRLPIGEAILESTRLLLRARKPGCADSHSGRMDGTFVNGQLDPTADMDPLRFVLAPEQPLRGRVAPRAAAAGAPLPPRVRVTWTSKVAEQGGWTHVPRQAIVDVDAEGRFAVPQLPLDAYEIRCYAPPLVADDGQLLPCALLAGRDRPRDEFDAAPGGLSRLELCAVAPDGGPCAGRLVRVFAFEGGFDCDRPAAILALDGQGRAGAWLPRDVEWHLVMCEPEGFAARSVRPQELAGERLQFTLEPYAEMHGRIVDDAGAPIVGARIEYAGARSMAPTGVRILLQSATAQLAQPRLLPVTTDAEGRFVARFVPANGLEISVRAVAGARRSEPFRLRCLAADEPLEVVAR